MKLDCALQLILPQTAEGSATVAYIFLFMLDILIGMFCSASTKRKKIIVSSLLLVLDYLQADFKM